MKLFEVKLSSLLKARIVDIPDMVSVSKFSIGDFETDSILVHYLYTGIEYLNSHTIRPNITGRDNSIL
jgi:hypothetical protein